MKEVIFDTNLVIDVEKTRNGHKNILSLLKKEQEGKLKIHIPVIVASEKTINGQSITNINQFKIYMNNLGFKNVELLKPICYTNLCFSNYCISPGPKTIKLTKEIHELLFDNIKFDLQEYRKNRNIDHKTKTTKKWSNALIDTLILWSAIWYGKKILITRDSNFHKNKGTILSKWEIEVKYSAEFLKEV